MKGSPLSASVQQQERRQPVQQGLTASPLADWRASPHVNASTGYQPALTRRELERGIVSYGDTSRLRRAMAKLLAGQPFSAAALGGSITK